MEKKVDCNIKKLKKGILMLLNQRVSESDGSGSPIGLDELEELLRKKFNFTEKKFCKALNNLSASFHLRIFLVPKRKTVGKGYTYVVDQILYGKEQKKK